MRTYGPRVRREEDPDDVAASVGVEHRSSTAYVQVDGRDLVTLSFGIGELGMEVEVTVFDSTRIDGGIAWQGTASVDHGESED